MSVPPWYGPWTEPQSVEHSAAGVEWMRARPDSVKALMKRFPPKCVVRLLAARCCGLRPGMLCVVGGYYEPEGEHAEGGLRIVDDPDGGTVHIVLPNEAEYVAPHNGMTPEWVEEALR